MSHSVSKLRKTFRSQKDNKDSGSIKDSILDTEVDNGTLFLNSMNDQKSGANLKPDVESG